MQSLWKSTRMLVLGVILVGLTVPTRAADLDKLAPADAEGVMVINFKNFLDSKLYEKFGKDAIEQALKDERAVEFLKSTGLDPMKDLTTLTVTFSGPATEPKVASILKGNFQVAKIQAVIEKEAEKAGEKLKIAKEGGTTFYTVTNPQGQEIIGTFLGNDAIVVSNNKDYLKTIISGKKGEVTDGAKILNKTVGGLGGKETLFMAFAITKEVREQLADNPGAVQFKDVVEKVESVSGTVNFTESIDLTLSVHAMDKASATRIAQLVKGVVPLAKLAVAGNEQAGPIVEALIDNLKIGSEGTTANARLQLTEELMKKLQPGGN